MKALWSGERYGVQTVEIRDHRKPRAKQQQGQQLDDTGVQEHPLHQQAQLDDDSVQAQPLQQQEQQLGDITAHARPKQQRRDQLQLTRHGQQQLSPALTSYQAHAPQPNQQMAHIIAVHCGTNGLAACAISADLKVRKSARQVAVLGFELVKNAAYKPATRLEVLPSMLVDCQLLNKLLREHPEAYVVLPRHRELPFANEYANEALRNKAAAVTLIANTIKQLHPAAQLLDMEPNSVNTAVKHATGTNPKAAAREAATGSNPNLLLESMTSGSNLQKRVSRMARSRLDIEAAAFIQSGGCSTPEALEKLNVFESPVDDSRDVATSFWMAMYVLQQGPVKLIKKAAKEGNTPLGAAAPAATPAAAAAAPLATGPAAAAAGDQSYKIVLVANNPTVVLVDNNPTGPQISAAAPAAAAAAGVSGGGLAASSRQQQVLKRDRPGSSPAAAAAAFVPGTPMQLQPTQTPADLDDSQQQLHKKRCRRLNSSWAAATPLPFDDLEAELGSAAGPAAAAGDDMPPAAAAEGTARNKRSRPAPPVGADVEVVDLLGDDGEA